MGTKGRCNVILNAGDWTQGLLHIGQAFYLQKRKIASLWVFFDYQRCNNSLQKQNYKYRSPYGPSFYKSKKMQGWEWKIGWFIQKLVSDLIWQTGTADSPCTCDLHSTLAWIISVHSPKWTIRGLVPSLVLLEGGGNIKMWSSEVRPMSLAHSLQRKWLWNLRPFSLSLYPGYWDNSSAHHMLPTIVGCVASSQLPKQKWQVAMDWKL